MGHRLVFFVAAVCALVLRVAVAEPPDLIGDLGAPERIRFFGHKTFSERQLRDAIAGNLKLIVASHPSATFQTYLDELHVHLDSGYKNSGFPHPVIKIIYDEQHSAITVFIDEGVRYRCGRIEVEGASKVPRDRILDYLAHGHFLKARSFSVARGRLEPQESSQKDPWKPTATVMWNVGKPAPFSDAYRRSLQRSLASIFQQHGYYKADVAFDLHPEADGTATLAINVRNEGPHGVLGAIKVSGNKKNSEADIIQFLGLTQGSPVDLVVTEEIRQKLRASARFVKQKVEIIHPEDGNGPSDLKLTVVENSDAPSLKRAFAPVELAALRVAEWIEGLTYSDDDIVAETQCTIKGDIAWDATPQKKKWNPLPNGFGIGTKSGVKKENADDRQRTFFGKVAFSPTRGEAMFHLRIVQHPETQLFDVRVIVRKKQLVLESAASKVRCELPVYESRFIGNINIVGCSPDKDGRMCRMMAGIGVASDASPKRSVKITCDPSCAIHEVELSQSRLKLEGDRLVYRDHDITVLFDAETGKLLSCHGILNRDENAEFKIHVAPGIYDAVAEEYLQETSEFTTMRLDESPFACLVALLAGNNGQMSAIESTQSIDRLLRLARRWQTHEQSRPLFPGHVNLRDGRRQSDSFFIPIDANPSDSTNFLYEYAFAMMSGLFPKESSAWMILREFAFISMGHSEHSSAVLTSIFESSECGPVANLLGAAVFGMINPNLKVEFANRGLRKLSVDDFEIDYTPFLTSKIFVGRAILSLGTLLQSCSDQEIDALVNLLALDGGPVRDAVTRSLKQFPQHRDRPSAKIIPEAINELWEPIIRPQVELLLTTYRGQEPRKNLLRIGRN